MAGPRIFWIVASLALVAATQGGVDYFCAQNAPHVVRRLRLDLAALPAQLGDWKIEAEGDDDEIDPKVRNVLGADEATTRSYKNSRGQRCSVHLACWYSKDQWTPHPPDLCYNGAGFLRRRQSVELLPVLSGHDESSDQPKHNVRSAQYAAQNGGSILDAVYWYQIGDNTFYDRTSGRPVMRKLWGKPERPPLIKVLMQTGEIDTREQRESLMQLAAAIQDHAAQL